MRILRPFLQKGAHMLQCFCGHRSKSTAIANGERQTHGDAAACVLRERRQGPRGAGCPAECVSLQAGEFSGQGSSYFARPGSRPAAGQGTDDAGIESLNFRGFSTTDSVTKGGRGVNWLQYCANFKTEWIIIQITGMVWIINAL